MPTVDTTLVAHISQLAQIPISHEEEKSLAAGFSTTLSVVEKLNEVDTRDTVPTSQVSGLENVWREDKIDSARTLSQNEALQNAQQTHNGYFVVAQLIDEENH